MSFKHLEEKHGELILYLQKNGYSSGIISNIRTVIKDIINNADFNGWSAYHEVYRTYEGRGYSKDVLRCKRHCIRVIEHFDNEGVFPDRSRRSYLFESKEYINLPEEYKELLTFYRQHDLDRGKKVSTIYQETANAITFFSTMSDRGCLHLEDITENDVISFFRADDGILIRSCSYKKNIAAVIKAGIEWREDPCRRILSFLPAIRESRKTIQYLTDEEVDRIDEALQSSESDLSMRDRAIGNLLLRMAIRSCDIAGLLLQSIDWENEAIHIVQRKTEVPLELPLTPVVGNAIFDYIDHERPVSEDPHIFLSEKIPHKSLDNGSIGNVANRIFNAAGIRQNPGDRRGTHIFRHHAASHMLENGVARPVISKILGHTSPDSLEPYLMADFKHLKECALSVEAFPIREEVLPL